MTVQTLEMVEMGLPDDRQQAPTSVMGFPHVQSSLNTLRRLEVGGFFFHAY
jgi:hypothetical protein